MSNWLSNRYSMPVRRDIEPIKTEPWMLDPDIIYLNHGSFGARVASVFEYQVSLKREFEASPVDFLDRQKDHIEHARNVVANFLGADGKGIGFVGNATTGVGCVVNSITFQPSDEILCTSHVYNGVRQLLTRTAKDAGCSYREIPVPLPVHSSSDLFEIVTKSMSNSTKLLVIDHVASASSIIFPVQEIAQYCREIGVLVLVDGAHAPGMLDLNIDQVGADWYVGNLHKWVCAPLGAGFVWASEGKRTTTHPMTVSHLYGQGFDKEFDWQGTRDISSWLASAAAVVWGNTIGWERIRQHNHSLVTAMQQDLVEAWEVEQFSPLDGSMLGNMATVRLPASCPQTRESCLAFRDEIYEKFKLEVPIFEFLGLGVVRVSAQLYSRETDVKRLITAIKALSINM
jgi:isopenicillin-N epimerase